MLALGTTMTRIVGDAGTAFDLYQWHKSFGFVVLGLALLRIALRRRAGRPPFPAGMSRRAKALAAATHGALYGLMIVTPLIGWIMASAAPLPVPTRFFDLFTIPDPVARSVALYEAARLAHRFAAWTLAGLVLLHVAAALKHHWFDRDVTLRRMLFSRKADA